MVNIFDALKSGGGAPTIFNRVTNVSKNQLLGQLQNDTNKKLQELEKKGQSQLAAQIGSESLEREKWRKFEKRIDEALDAVNNIQTRLVGIDSRLDKMLLEINKAKIADEDPSVDMAYEAYARAFDSHYAAIQDLAENSRVSPNLLDTGSLSLQYPTSVHGAYNTILGTRITPNYTIQDSGGKIWEVDFQSKLLRQYTDYPTQTSNKVGNMYDGNLVINSLDSSDNIDFTIASNTTSPENFTGTITREGLGLLHAWAYDNLDSSTGRQKASDEVYGARSIIKLEQQRYNMATTALKYYKETISAEIEGIDDRITEIRRESGMKLAQQRDKLVQEFQVTQNLVAQSFIIRSNYSSLIPSPMSGFFKLLA